MKLYLFAGAISVSGRLDLLRKRNGVWIDLHQIELVAKQHPDIEEAGAFLGRPEESNQPLTLCLEPKSNSNVFLKMLRLNEKFVGDNQDFMQSMRMWMVQNLPSAAQPTHFRYCQQIPRSSAGKIKRVALESSDSFVSGKNVDLKIVTPSTQIEHNLSGKKSSVKVSETQVLRVFCHALDVEGMEPTSDFFLCGGTSLAANVVASKLCISPSLIWSYRTPRKLAQALANDHIAFDANSEPNMPNKKAVYSIQVEVVKGAELGARNSGVQLRIKRSLFASNTIVDSDCPEHISHKDKRRKLASVSTQHRVGTTEMHGVQNRKKPITVLEYSLLEEPDGSISPKRKERPYSAIEYISAWELGEFDSCLISCRPMHCVEITHSGAILWESSKQADLDTFMHHHKNSFKRVWSRKLSLCVDALPAILVFLGGSSDCDPKGLVFACCHRGEVACFQLHSGAQVWSTILPKRTDAGFAITKNLKYVVVGSESEIFFLDLINGQTYQKVDAGSTVNGPPVMDPWKGYIWTASHANQVVVTDPSGNLLYRYNLRSTSSA